MSKQVSIDTGALIRLLQRGRTYCGLCRRFTTWREVHPLVDASGHALNNVARYHATRCDLHVTKSLPTKYTPREVYREEDADAADVRLANAALEAAGMFDE